MCTNIERYYLNGNYSSTLGFENLTELNGPNFRSPYATVQNCLIQQYTITRSVILFKQLLATQPHFDSLIMYRRIYLRSYGLNKCSRIFLGLQQPRNKVHRVRGNSCGYCLEPNVWVELDILVLCPPALF